MALSPCIASRRTLKNPTKGSLKKYTKAAQNSGRSEVPSFKSADISKKAHNGAANSPSMEHFVLKGCFTTRLFSPCQDHRNPQDTHAESAVSTAQRGFKEDARLSNTSSGKSHLGSFQCWCKSAVLLHLWWHYSLGTCLCCSHFAVVFLTLGFYRRVLQQVCGKWHHQPSVQSV